MLCFVVGQLFEFVINEQICQKTSGAIDGAMFQTLLSFVAMLFFYTLWTSITEDDWFTSIPYDDFESVRASAPKSRAPMYQPIKIEQPTGLTLTETLSKLNWYKETFLNQVENDIKDFIERSRKRDCTAIIAIRPSGSRIVYRIQNDGWARRLRAMAKHKDRLNSGNSSLPMYDGDQLDSYLSQPIMDRVGELHSQFLRDQGDVLGSHMVERLRNNPEVYRAFARQFAQSVRDAGEPLTTELYEALVHLVQHRLSSHATDELGRHLGHALMHVGGNAEITCFTTAMAHVFHAAITKVLIKYTSAFALKSVFLVAGKIIGKAVLGAFVAHVTAHLAAHASGAAAILPVYLALLPLVAIFTAHEIDKFPEKLARKIAPNVRQVVAGDFESRNQSALELTFKDTFKDGAKKICEILLSESQMAEKARQPQKKCFRLRGRGPSKSIINCSMLFLTNTSYEHIRRTLSSKVFLCYHHGDTCRQPHVAFQIKIVIVSTAERAAISYHPCFLRLLLRHRPLPVHCSRLLLEINPRPRRATIRRPT
jgi:hypothetical protein